MGSPILKCTETPCLRAWVGRTLHMQACRVALTARAGRPQDTDCQAAGPAPHRAHLQWLPVPLVGVEAATMSLDSRNVTNQTSQSQNKHIQQRAAAGSWGSVLGAMHTCCSPGVCPPGTQLARRHVDPLCGTGSSEDTPKPKLQNCHALIIGDLGGSRKGQRLPQGRVLGDGPLGVQAPAQSPCLGSS